MNTIDKIKNSWWVLLSFIMFLNGFGFVYIGLKHNNRNWLFEGVMYEIPWFFYFVYYGIYGLPKNIGVNPTNLIIIFALMLMFVGIIRSIWVAIKLNDVYANYEKYAINPVELNNVNNASDNANVSGKMGCCMCLIVIFLMFAIIAIL
jgi:predicted membrane metal-binding protein